MKPKNAADDDVDILWINQTIEATMSEQVQEGQRVAGRKDGRTDDEGGWMGWDGRSEQQ